LLEALNQQLAAVQRMNAPAQRVYGAPRTMRGRPKRIARGGPIHCPVCGGRFRTFLPFGLAQRRHARCPGCGSLERHRFLWLLLAREYRLLLRRARVLHVSPERCIRKALAANRALRYLSVDLFDPAVNRAADLTALPFADGAFDVAICSHVLEHIADDRAAMTELYRVLAPGGRAAVMVPLDPQRAETFEDPSIDDAAGRMAAFGHPYHVRICGADYPGRLRDAGFRVRVLHSHRLSPHERRRWRISKTVVIDCRKPARNVRK